MAQLLLSPEHQIQRINSIINKVESMQQLPLQTLITSPKPKSWNILEVLEHLSIAYKLYEKKIESTLRQAPESSTTPWTFRVRTWQRFIIESQRPKGKKRPFKIKTLKRFEPVLEKNRLKSDQAQMIFQRFLDSYGKLKRCIIDSRNKQLQHTTIASAIGPIVRFYLPEAFEFLICHVERHMVQIEEILTRKK